ncbi:hypothetical protein CQA53_06990 [Helicobacter didelphidarum]|uniref:Lipoprotein n=1 Tax=Helicobacter didelphidarum TaxID=2040648 RepID=A0A3D8IIW1_9HELI|nr:hypothetical protein [Helicobacter didelphidarum]RDU64980.1 hypothetical protein CQA53_06990 [Helicobacter didelphidarum]
MIKYLYLYFIGFSYLFFSACSINHEILSLIESKKVGFISDGSYVLQDPPKDKARIYVFRDNSPVGSYLGYTLRIQYDPELDSKGRPDYHNYQDSLGYMATARTFYADIWVGHRVAIMARTEATSYLVFTPMEGQIYCIKGNMKNGWSMPRPNIVFVGKRACEEAWIDYFKSENIDFQNQWRKVYNERGDRILSESPFPTQQEDSGN